MSYLYHELITLTISLFTGSDGGSRTLNVSSCRILSPVCLAYCTTSPFLIFYKYYNIFYRNCQDFYWLGWLDSNQRNPWFWGMILDYAPIKVLILSFKAMCLTPWLHPILYKYYIIFYNICQDFLLAEVRGFEPLNPFRGLSLSKGVFYSHSTTLPTFYKYYIIF